MNLLTKQKTTHKHIKQTYGYERGLQELEGEENQEFRINIKTRLYIRQANNRDPMYSTENYTQYLVMTYNGNESNKEYTYITYVYIYMYN